MPSLTRPALLSTLLLSLFTQGTQAITVTRTSGYQYEVATGLLAKELVEASNSNLCLVKTYTYDGYGNRNGGTTRNCNGSSGEAAAPSGGAVIVPRTTGATYEATGRFPQAISNALNQTETRVYDARFNTVSSLTDSNGQTTTWQYDSLGRKTLETRPDGTKTKWDYLYCTGVNGGTAACFSYAKYLIQATPLAADGVTQNGSWIKVYYNALEREVRGETQGFDGSAVIVNATDYTSRKEIYRTSRPYYSSQTPQWTTHTYDTLSRVVNETYPDTSQVSRTYNGLTTTVTHPLSQTKTTLANSQGQTVRITDASGNAINYQYDPFGNLATTTDPLGNSIVVTYDVRGNRTAIADPDLGSWTYVYDALGQSVSQTDAKAQTTTFVFDTLGRMTQRSAPELIGTWTYDSCTYGIGRLCQSATSTGYSQTTTYDSLGRPSGISTQIDVLYSQGITYDAQGRIATRTYPTGQIVRNVYTALGYLSEVRNGDVGNALYWQANSLDAEGHFLQQTHGNGIVTVQAYNSANGRLTSITAGAGNIVQNFTYQYDLLGNITTRTDGNQTLTETFLHDNLNRLTGSTVNSSGAGIVSETYSYNAIGNVTGRTDLGTYTYNPSGATSVRPHGVSEVALAAGGKRQYSYDANGNLAGEVVLDAGGNVVPNTGRTLSYTSFNMPGAIATTSATSSFDYGPDLQRVRQLSSQSGTTIYLNPDNAGALYYEKDTKPDSSTEHRHFVSAAGTVVALIKQTNVGIEIRYLYRDNLGSTTTATDSSGAVVERLAYEPFGKRRFPAGMDDPGDTLVAQTTERGFTNHEHMEELGLIHMNGRVYDPMLMRFTSADPTMPNAFDLQSYNRYSYVRNNPLRLLDPSGFADEPAGTNPQIRGDAHTERGFEPLSRGNAGGQPLTLNPPWSNVYNIGMTGDPLNSVGDRAREFASGVNGEYRSVMEARSAAYDAGSTVRTFGEVGIAMLPGSSLPLVGESLGQGHFGTAEILLATELLGPLKGVRAISGLERAAAKGEAAFFRGAKVGEAPSFVPRPNDFKVDPKTGFVKDTHGVSVFDNPLSVSSKGYVPHRVDQNSIPDSLRIIQRGGDSRHFEIVPNPSANLTPQQFINACGGIACVK